MLRLLHTADVHLGAPHEDLGDAGSVLRERQHAAFRATVDLALAERVDLVLIAGDLFDANTASRRSVERVVVELERLAAARIRIVLVPGCHDAYTRSSVYRAYDLPSLVGGEMLTVLTPDGPWVHLDSLDAVVIGPADGSRPSAGPFAAMSGEESVAPTWRIGLLHAAAGDGKGHVPIAAIAASGLDFAALGHAHHAASGKEGATTWAIPGSPEQVEVDRAQPGTVNLVTLDEFSGVKAVSLDTRVVGTSRHREIKVDAASIAAQVELVDRLRADADPDVVLDVNLVGERSDELGVDGPAIAEALRGAYLRVRVHDRSRPPLTAGPLPPTETIAGAFIHNVEGRIAELEAAGTAAATDEAAELREVLRLGRQQLTGTEVGS